jgi:hypothetical protein
VLKKDKGGGRAVQVGGEHGGQGGREAKEYLQQRAAKGGQGRGLALAASLHTEGTDPHPTDSSGSASSSKVCPPRVHDKIFVSCQMLKDCDVAGISGDEDWSTDVDVSDKITSLLTKSAEPVVSFRIDSSKWTDSSYLDKWLDLLSQKSVQELHLLNLGHKVSTVFPIESLQSKKPSVFEDWVFYSELGSVLL